MVAAALAGSVIIRAGIATAGDLKIRYSVDSSLELTDNLNLTNTNPESAFISTQSVGANIRQEGSRSSLFLDYRLDLETINGEFQDTNVRNNLQGIGQVEVIEDLFFVDGQVISRRAIVDPAGPVGSSDRIGRGNLAEVTTIEVAPALRQNLGLYGDGELARRYRQVSTDGSAAADQTTITDSLRLNTGRRIFEWVQLSSLFERSDVDSDNDRSDLTRHTAELMAYIPLSAEFALLSSGGYENIDTRSGLQESDGLIWTVGFDWHPTTRTGLRLAGGERYGGMILQGNLRHQLSARLLFEADYAESISTALDTNQFGGLAVATGLQPGLQPGQIFDTRTGLPLERDALGLGLGDDIFRNKRFVASVTASFPRDTLRLIFVNDVREFDTRPSRTVQSFSSVYSRRLQRDLDVDVTLSYRSADTSSSATATSGTQDTVTGQALLRHRLTKDLSASVAYTRTERFSDIASGEYTENAVLLSVRQAF